MVEDLDIPLMSVHELSISFKIPNSPSKTSTNKPTAMGPIGVSLNGVPFYNQVLIKRSTLGKFRV